MTTYERLDILRKQKGTTWKHLAILIGGYEKKMSDVKRGAVSLTDDELKTLADFLGTTFEYLKTGDESAENKKSPAEHGEAVSYKQRISDLIEASGEDEDALWEIINAASAKLRAIRGKNEQ